MLLKEQDGLSLAPMQAYSDGQTGTSCYRLTLRQSSDEPVYSGEQKTDDIESIN